MTEILLIVTIVLLVIVIVLQFVFKPKVSETHNSLQKRGGEVWKVLDAVKTEFEKSGDLIQKTWADIQVGLYQLDDGIATHTRAIQRSLKNIEVLSVEETKLILPESNTIDDNEN